MKTLDKVKIQAELLEKLEQKLATPAFESWIKHIQITFISENTLTIATDSNLGKGWILKNCQDLIIEIIHEITGTNPKLNIDVEKIERPKAATRLEKPKSSQRKNDKASINKSTNLTENNIDSLKSLSNNLNLKYTFDSFVVGAHNKFAHAAAYAVAKTPAKAHNPLFIYGGVGLGKTHLMQAVGHHIISHHPGLKIKYCSAETFTNELISSIRNDKMPAFRAKYRQIDVLLLDDIQFIEGKESTQEEFFHTFNTLYESGKQVVLTSDRHPKNISTLTERLRSRFEWGILADIQVPELETRIAILRNKAEMDNLTVPQDVLELIATAYQSNIRELEGALNRVVAYSSINNQPITVDNVRNIINVSSKVRNLSFDKIIDATAKYFAIDSSEIKGPGRVKEVSHARQVAIYLSRDMTNSSFPTIGEAFGGRKHTTILYAYEKMKEELQTNRVLAETISEIKKKISADS